jgi:hypothetical protein
MGYYIETPGHNKGKAGCIVYNHNGTIVGTPDEGDWSKYRAEGKALVCVVDNGPFEAAGFAFSEQEMKEFALSGPLRPRTWLTIDWDIACQLTGYDR